ncbi:MAG: DUF4369 domain-containing protein [Prevotellaceae bacterium]|nr:DUF4369 domain-containing protein [Candidatus Minthosoma equi]
MKRGLFLFASVFLLLLASCDKSSNEVGECRVHGTLPDDKYNGKCIYMIALDKSIRDSIGVDSCYVENCKFEFVTRKHMMAIIRMDFHFRMGLEDLLVVEEPGDIYVTIDSISSARGTENNDKLQQWKDITEIRNEKYHSLIMLYHAASDSGDSITANSIKHKADSIHVDYKNVTRNMAKELPDGPLKDFLGEMFPLTHKKRMPDGTIVEVSADEY